MLPVLNNRAERMVSAMAHVQIVEARLTTVHRTHGLTQPYPSLQPLCIMGAFYTFVPCITLKRPLSWHAAFPAEISVTNRIFSALAANVKQAFATRKLGSRW
jgi:hypothetical protein